MNNPPIVTRAITTPPALSIAKLALLEQINSPFLGEPKPVPLTEILPSRYIYHLPLPEAIAIAKDPEIQAKALLWAEALNQEKYLQKIDALNDAITSFFAALPRPEEKDAKKA